MKTRKNLSHNHKVGGDSHVSIYDGWRDMVTITIRDDREVGSDEVSIELPNNVFETLVARVNGVVDERKAKLEESEVE